LFFPLVYRLLLAVRENATHAKFRSKDIARHRVSLGRIGPVGIGCICIMGAAILVTWFVCPRNPPDLTDCTRVEVHYTRYTQGAIGYFFGWIPMLERVLSEQERQYIRSFDKWTVTDQEQIRAFADQIRQGKHRGRVIPGGKILAVPVDIRCYRGRRRVASFSIYCGIPPAIPPAMAQDKVIANGHEFACQPGLRILRNLDPPILKPLIARWECAMKLSALLFGGLWLGPDRLPCPDPNQWCDVIVQNMRRKHITDYRLDGKRKRQYPNRVIARRFTCPAVHAPTDANGVYSPPDETDPLSQPADSWVSDYAMNSNCREGSPDDMVFLFESQPGWNQYGGPELFTFDNHDPKGGCVLLNDGKVKFIHTKEELQQLRWE
jgi:hypothetical protein